MSWDPVTQKHKGFAFVEYEIVSFKKNWRVIVIYIEKFKTLA